MLPSNLKSNQATLRDDDICYACALQRMLGNIFDMFSAIALHSTTIEPDSTMKLTLKSSRYNCCNVATGSYLLRVLF